LEGDQFHSRRGYPSPRFRRWKQIFGEIVNVAPRRALVPHKKKNPNRKGPGNFHAFQYGHPREMAVDIVEGAVTGSGTAASLRSGGATARLERVRTVPAGWEGD